MNNFGSFLLGSITGAVALGALAWKFGEDSVSDTELDEIAADAAKTVKRCDEIIEEADRLEKENESIDVNDKDSLDKLNEVNSKLNALNTELSNLCKGAEN
jgi:uncharacterized coiled-coil DUF342 family protein